MINIKSFDSNLLKIDKLKKMNKNIDIYNTKHITIKDLDHRNPLYLIFNKIDGHTEENNENKYLIFASPDKDKKLLTQNTELWNKIKNLIEKISGKPVKYEKELIRIKFDSDDNRHLNNLLKLYKLTIIVGSVFRKGINYYLQIYLYECFYKL